MVFERLKSVLIKRKYGYVSFMTASLCMWLTLCFLGLVGAGDYSLIDGDMLENYIPAIRNLCRDILSGNSVYYSWTMCMGMNTSLYNAYYAYNPFNLFYLLFDFDDNAITAFIIVVKTGLAAFFMQHLMASRLKIVEYWSVVFSVLYAMCSFQVTYNIMNIIWLDALFVLPVAVEGIYALVEENNKKLLLISLSYIFITQFYMGYMIGLASLIFFVLYLWNIKKKFDIKQMIRPISDYLIDVILAVGVSSIVWLPALMFLKNNNPADASAFWGVDGNVFDLLSRFYIGEVDGIYAYKPNVFCGVLSIIGIPFFFINSGIQKSEKKIWGIWGALMFASCVFAPLYIFWHGLDAPDGWGYRFAYIICFIACVMGAKAFSAEDKSAISKLIVISVTEIIFYIAYKYIGSRIELNVFLANAITIIAWTTVLVLINKTKLMETIISRSLIIILVSIECVLCGYLSYYQCPDLQPNLWRVMFDTWNFSEKNVVKSLKSDPGFFRVNYLYDYGINSGTYYGYNSISDFSSAENPSVRYTMSALGLNSTPRMLLNHGLTDMTKMLFDVKYDVIGTVLKENMTDMDYYPQIIENDNILGLGYLVDEDILEFDVSGTNAFENNNRLISAMMGENIKVFKSISSDKVYITGEGINLNYSDAGYELSVSDSSINDSERNITFHIIDQADQITYVYMSNSVSSRRGDSAGFLLDGGPENSIYHRGFVSTPYIKELQSEGTEKILKIVVNGAATNQHVDDIVFYTIDKTTLSEIYRKLSLSQMSVKELRDGYIVGHIRNGGDAKVLFTSIPYDKGWKIKLNGREYQAIPTLNNAFLGVIIPEKGDFDIEFRFEAQGSKAGIIASVVFILFISLTIYKEKINNLKKN